MITRTLCSQPLPSWPEVLLTVHHPTRRPVDEDWERHLAECRRGLEAAIERDREPVNLVFSDGPGPTVTQRELVHQIVEQLGRLPRVAVVSSSTLTRGICTAARWKGLPVTPFAPSRWAEALAHLGLTRPEVVEELRAGSTGMIERLGVVPRSLQPFLSNRD